MTNINKILSGQNSTKSEGNFYNQGSIRIASLIFFVVLIDITSNQESYSFFIYSVFSSLALALVNGLYVLNKYKKGVADGGDFMSRNKKNIRSQYVYGILTFSGIGIMCLSIIFGRGSDEISVYIKFSCILVSSIFIFISLLLIFLYLKEKNTI